MDLYEYRDDLEFHSELAAFQKVPIAQNMVNLGLPFETVVPATQFEPEKVKALYNFQ